MIAQYKVDLITPIAEKKISAYQNEYDLAVKNIYKERRPKGYKRFFFSRPLKEDEEIHKFVNRKLGALIHLDNKYLNKISLLQDIIRHCRRAETILLDEDERHVIFGYE